MKHYIFIIHELVSRSAKQLSLLNSMTLNKVLNFYLVSDFCSLCQGPGGKCVREDGVPPKCDCIAGFNGTYCENGKYDDFHN